MNILRLKIVHQEAILLKSAIPLQNVTINSINKILYFKIDSRDPTITIPSSSSIDLNNYFKIELNEGTYVVNPLTLKNDNLANEIDLKIRSIDSYYGSFPESYKFCYIDDNLKLVIRSLTLTPNSSVTLFNNLGDSFLDEIPFNELKIKGVVEKNFNNYIKEEIIKFSVFIETSDLGDINITNQIIDVNSKLNIYSLDPINFYIIPNSYDPSLKTIDILAKNEGSGIIKVVYEYNGETFYYSKQFLCHSSFFKDNYLTYFLPFTDANTIRSNQFVKSIFDTLMEMLDILYAHNEDLKVIPNFSEGKSKFISSLAQNLGFERIDFTDFNSKYEFTNDESFREIIGNIFDLLSVRGTKLAYDLFFNALGYDITIQEFWYDSDGNLIEINEEDESKSTFFAYTREGGLIDNPPVARKDPRQYNQLLTNDYNDFKTNYVRILRDDGSFYYSYNNDVQLFPKTNSISPHVLRNNKSNYTRIIFNENINSNFVEPVSFSLEKRLVIKRYLEFLRPSHIQYILETFGVDISSTTEIIQSFNEQVSFSILNVFKDLLLDEIFNIDDSDFNIGDVKSIIEEVSSSRKWDTLLKFDDQNDYDFKELLTEEFNWELI